jgi:hypothetical protein
MGSLIERLSLLGLMQKSASPKQQIYKIEKGGALD